MGRASPDRAGARPYRVRSRITSLSRATRINSNGTRSRAIRRCRGEPRWNVPDGGLLRPLGGRNVLRVAREIDDLVRGVCRSPGVVDHVFDGADTAQGYSNEIVELDRRKIGDLEGVGIDDAR